MGTRFRFRWLIGVLAIATIAAVGMYAYNLGVARGVAESARLIAAPEGGVPMAAYWPRPWGYGFGFFPFFPLLFILFWFTLLRGVFWRGGWHRHGYRGVPPAWDEWHRRAHAQQDPPPATDVKA